MSTRLVDTAPQMPESQYTRTAFSIEDFIVDPSQNLLNYSSMPLYGMRFCRASWQHRATRQRDCYSAFCFRYISLLIMSFSSLQELAEDMEVLLAPSIVVASGVGDGGGNVSQSQQEPTWSYWHASQGLAEGIEVLLAPRIVAATGGGGGGNEMETPAALGSLAQALLLARAAQVKKVPFATKVLDHDFFCSGSTS